LDRARAADGGPLLPAELDFVRINTKGAEDGIYYAGGAETRWRKEVNGRVYMTRAVPPHSAGHARVYRAAWQEMSERFSQQHFPAWEYWAPEVIAAARRLAAFDPRQADGQVLAEHLEDVLAAATRAWMIHILFGPRMIRPPALAEAYARIAGLQPRDVSPEIPFLLAGAETIQTRLVETLFDLACLVGNSPDEAKAIVLQKAQLSATSPGMAAFALTFERLMSEYGDRLCYGSMPGFPAQVPLPWRESPEHVWEMIRSYLPLAQQGGPGPRQLRLQARDAVGERVEALCAAAIENKIDPDVVQNFRGQLAFWRERAAGLDEHNHYIDQLSEGQFYQAFLYAGRWLAAQGILPGPFEIFWLHAPEVLAALRGFVHDLDSIIAERRLQFSDWQSLIAPPCLGLPDAHLPGRPEQLVAETVSRSDVNLPPNTLSGEPASRGHAHGRARLIAGDALPADIASGDIIVAPFAGPALIPLLPAIAAVVLDYGGPGDHFAITAREFGIPAVCSTLHATRRIPEGAQLTIDAGSGLVTWL
jgi:phosphohistidine swiveling domain-containing protein